MNHKASKAKESFVDKHFRRCPLRFERLIFVFVFFGIISQARAQANCSTDTGFTYYVRTSGSDSNNGRSYAAAFRTIQKAANVATAGQSVCIAAGRYRERVTLPNSGTSETNRITFLGEAPSLPCLDEARCTILDPSDRYPDGWVQCSGSNCSAEGITDPKVWKRTGTSPGFYHYALISGPEGKKYPIFSAATCSTYNPPGCAFGVGASDSGDWRATLSNGPSLFPVGSTYGTPKARTWNGVPAIFADPESNLDTTLFCRISGAASPTYSDGQSPNSLDIDFVPRASALSIDGRSWITVKNIAVPASWVALSQNGGVGLRLERLSIGPSRRGIYLTNNSNAKLQNSYFTHGWWPSDGLSAGAQIKVHAGADYQWLAYSLNKNASASEGGSNSSPAMFINVTDFEFSGNAIVDTLAGPAFTSGAGGGYTTGTAGMNVLIHDNVVDRNNTSALWISDNQINLRVYDNLFLQVDQCLRHFIGTGPAYLYRNRCFSSRSPITEGFGPDFDRMIYAPPYHGITVTPKIYLYHNSVSTKVCMRVANTYSDEGELKAADASGVRWLNNLFTCDVVDYNTGNLWAARAVVQYNWFNVPKQSWMSSNNVHNVGGDAWVRCGSEPCTVPNWQPPASAQQIGVDVTRENISLGIPSGGLPGFSAGYFSGTAPDAGAVQHGGDTQAPIISNVRASNITATTAEISWNLNEPGTGQIEYGTSTDYGSFSLLEPSYNYSAHAQTLTVLLANTLYHYRIRSADAAGNLAISGDYTFQTSVSTALPSPPSGLRIVP